MCLKTPDQRTTRRRRIDVPQHLVQVLNNALRSRILSVQIVAALSKVLPHRYSIGKTQARKVECALYVS